MLIISREQQQHVEALAKEYKTASRKDKSRLVEQILRYFEGRIVGSMCNIENYAFYIQCARVRIFTALEKFDPSRGVYFTVYLLLWLRKVNSDYRASQNMIGHSSKAIKFFDISTSGDECELEAKNTGIDSDVLEDLRKVLTKEEFIYTRMKYEGYYNKDIAKVLKIRRRDVSNVAYTSRIMIERYMKGLL